MKHRLGPLLGTAFLCPFHFGLPQGIAEEPPCSATASLATSALRVQVYEQLLLELAACVNTGGGSECVSGAWTEYTDSLQEIEEVHAARLKLCGLLGEAPHAPLAAVPLYAPEVTHPLFPLPPGTTWIYRRRGVEGVERVEVTVLEEKRTIAGVSCTTIRVTETLDGELAEVTYDWHAQDVLGNVWYFGESSMEFEDGVPIGMDGSWRAGTDGAQPGIAMLASPEVGDAYRKEFKLGEAEDAAMVVEAGVDVTVASGTYRGTLRVRDFSPLEPDDGEDEDKYYAPGVGLVLEVDNATGERLELVQVVRP